MLPAVAHLLRRPFRALLTIPLLLALVALGTISFAVRETVRPQTADAAITAGTHGTGYTIKGQWFGSWVQGGARGFCIDFDRGHPDSGSLKHLNGNVPGMATEDSARVKYIVNKYGDTNDKTTAAAVSIFVWKIQRTTRFNTFYAKLLKEKAIPASLRKKELQLVEESKLHGPFRIVIAQKAALPGQTFTGTAKVTTKSGKALGDAPLTLSTTNASFVSKTGKTDKSGTVRFTSRVQGAGQVTTTATLDMPSANASWINSPTAGHQRLVMAGKGRQTTSARAASVKTQNGPTVQNLCNGDCNGAAPVKVTMKNGSGRKVREYVYKNGTLAASFDVAARATVSKNVTMADAAVVTTKWCYVKANGACDAAPVSVGAPLTVECPKWIDYTYEGTCPCDPGKNLTFVVSVPADSTRTYTVNLVVTPTTGAVVPYTKVMKGGDKYRFPPLRFANGTKVTLSFTVLGKTHLLDAMTQDV